MSWLSECVAPNRPSTACSVTSARCGSENRTFRGDDPNKGTENEGAYGGAWDGPQIVVTHHIPDEPVPGVTFAGDLAGGVTAAREAAGDKYVSILGADIARPCLAAGWLDEILVCVVPLLLGMAFACSTCLVART